MKNIKTLILLLLIASTGFGQSLSPRVTATAGGRATGGGVSLSYTTGETFNTKLSANNKQLTQGQQQPEIDLRVGIAQATACNGSNISVPFTAAGYVDPANVFTLELSDVNGSFANPVIIGSATSMVSGTIEAIIPSGVVGRILAVLQYCNLTSQFRQAFLLVATHAFNVTARSLYGLERTAKNTLPTTRKVGRTIKNSKFPCNHK
jgi:hypothetical protein